MTTTGVTISWTVSEVATGQVDYGTTTSYGSQSVAETSLDYSTHIQTISGLTAGTDLPLPRPLDDRVAASALVSGDHVFTTAGATAAPAPTPVPTPRRPAPVSTPAPTHRPRHRSPTGSDPATAGQPPVPAPAPARRVDVPSRSTRAASTDVGSALNSFINGVPDGSVITFPVNGVYRLSTGIRLDSRHNLVFDGRGTTIRTTGSGGSALSSPFVLSWASSNTDIWIRNFILEGNNTRTGAAIYDGAQESQMGIDLNGGARIELSGLTIRRMNGDGLYANENTPTAGSATAWPTDIWFHDSSIDSVGRNAFTINSGRRVTLERNIIDHVGGSVLDIEPDLDTQGAVDLILRNNTVGAWGLSPKYTMHSSPAPAGGGTGARVDGVTITGNTVTVGAPESPNNHNAPGLFTEFGRPARMSRITFTNNTSTKIGGGPALRFSRIDGLTVNGNSQPVTSGSMTYIYDSTNVVQ